MIVDSKLLTPESVDSMWPITVHIDTDPDFPFEITEAGRELSLSTAEAKALLKFLKKHLEPKLENV